MLKHVKRITSAKHFKLTAIIIFFAISFVLWFSYWIYSHYHISTDDAYMNANVVNIAPRVSGQVIQIFVSNNAYVKKNQPLFAIDSEPYTLAIKSAESEVAIREAELYKAKITNDRTKPLVSKNYMAQQEGDITNANVQAAQGELAAANAQLEKAKLNLSYTQVVAPTSGWVTNFTLRVGNNVSLGVPLFALISDEEFWADANFKETEMQAIKPGQTASVIVDLYPNHSFPAVVGSISGSTGSAFSLLPPQNATGNWVKVTQRIPVKVIILKTDPKFPIRVGASATVEINLQEYLTSATTHD